MDELDAVLAADIGGTHLRVGLVGRALAVRAFEIVGSIGILEVPDPSAALADYLEDFMRRLGAGVRLAAVAVGFPATIDKSRRVVLSTSNIRSMQRMAIADFLEPRFGVPVVIDRDANMLLRHDMSTYHVTGAGIVVGCYVGTGLGNAISIDGRILVGRHGVAGELGHLPVKGLARACGCGNIGCVETIASGRYFAELARECFPQTPMGEVFLQHGDQPVIVEFIRSIAMAIASEVNILDPEVVVLGGGVIQAPGFPQTVLEAAIREMSRKPLPSEDIVFVYSSGGQQAGVIGAGIYGFEALDALGAQPVHDLPRRRTS